MAGSYLISNTGWWMQLTAMNWLVLGLTGSPAAVGLTSGLVFLPTLVLGMLGGLVADRFPKRRIVLVMYIGWATLTALLAGLTLSNMVMVWHVQLIAAALGVVNAFCWPGQQAFVAELVEQAQLRGAISITSSVTQLATLLGPAAGGFLVSSAGPGWSFLTASGCYLVPLVALLNIRLHELLELPKMAPERGQLKAAIRFALSRPDVLWSIILVGLFVMFTGNLSVTLAVYANTASIGPEGYGALTATVAIGSLIGALVSGRQHQTRLRTLVLVGTLLSAFYVAAALVSSQLVVAVLLLGIGAIGLILQTSANSMVQLAAPDRIRGRIVAIYILIYSGGIAVGGPLVGGILEHAGPRGGLLAAGIIPGTATLAIAALLACRLLRRRRANRSGIQGLR